jgi:hypothetical protein
MSLNLEQLDVLNQEQIRLLSDLKTGIACLKQIHNLRKEERDTARYQADRLREAILDAVTRMQRARDILTDYNPRPECNWDMLDTESLKKFLKM